MCRQKDTLRLREHDEMSSTGRGAEVARATARIRLYKSGGRSRKGSRGKARSRKGAVEKRHSRGQARSRAGTVGGRHGRGQARSRAGTVEHEQTSRRKQRPATMRTGQTSREKGGAHPTEQHKAVTNSFSMRQAQHSTTTKNTGPLAASGPFSTSRSILWRRLNCQ